MLGAAALPAVANRPPVEGPKLDRNTGAGLLIDDIPWLGCGVNPNGMKGEGPWSFPNSKSCGVVDADDVLASSLTGLRTAGGAKSEGVWSGVEKRAGELLEAEGMLRLADSPWFLARRCFFPRRLSTLPPPAFGGELPAALPPPGFLAGVFTLASASVSSGTFAAVAAFWRDL